MELFTADTWWCYILGSPFLSEMAEAADFLVPLVRKPML